MSDDIYLGRRESNRGCFVLLGVFALLLALIAYFWINRDSSPRQKETPSAEGQATREVPASATTQRNQAAKPAVSDIKLLARANEAKANGELPAARKAALRMLEQSTNARSRRAAENLLSEIHPAMVFSKMPMEEKQEYVIKSGDILGKIARKYGTTVEMIQRGNGLRGSLIRVGDRLRILTGTFSIKVSKSKNDLEVYLNDRFFKRYSVGTGAHGMTPVGEFKVNDRIAQPTWWRNDGRAIPYGDEENLLGTHWISLDIRGYGIHGTWEPETIGKQASAGCVRMLNEDVEELYNLIPLGTKVTISE